MFDPADLKKLDLAGIAITAKLRADGALGPVGGVEAKLAAAARTAFPKIHTVIVAKVSTGEQEARNRTRDFAALGLREDPPGSGEFRDPSDEFYVVPAADLAEAARLAAEHSQGRRWPGIDEECPPPPPADFVGRAGLKQAVRDFIAREDSGYLVIYGAMGKGKSTALAHIAHEEGARRGERAICHVIDSSPASTGAPARIARCLYDQLRRKYGIPARADWDDRSAGDLLEDVLKHVSTRRQGREAELRRQNAAVRVEPEVLFVDAADQAQLKPGQTLLPGALPALPAKVVAVVTSRPDQAWLRTVEGLRELEMEEADDWADVGAYLRMRSARLATPLDEALIEQILRRAHEQDRPPIFFTVNACFKALEHPDTLPSEREVLRGDPARWRVPAEELIRREGERRQGEAERDGIPRSTFWRTLGLFAVARDAVSERDMRGLGLWDERITERVLWHARNFFTRRPRLPAPGEPYRFGHPGYQREVLVHIDPVDVHRQLGDACERSWQEPENAGRWYALRHVAAHGREGRRWDQLCHTLTDVEYLETALRRASGGGGAMEVFDLTRELAEALAVLPEASAGRAEVEAIRRAIDWTSHVLKEDGTLLLQALHNGLVWDWDETTRLGQRLRKAGARPARRWWLKQLHRPLVTTDPALLRTLTGHADPVTAVAFSPDGTQVASGSWARTVTLWDAWTGDEERTLTGHIGWVTAVAFSPDGTLVASGSEDGTVKLWDAQTGAAARTLRGHTDGVTSVAFSRDGTQVASGSGNGTVKVWATRTGAEERTLRGHTSLVSAVAFSPDGTQVASGSWDETVNLWATRTGALERTLSGHTGGVTAVAFSAGGTQVTSGSGDGTVKVWAARTGAAVRTLPGHTAWVNAVAFSPDGTQVASGSEDGAVTLWDARTGAERRMLPGHTGGVRAVAFSADGTQVASGSGDGTVKLWGTRTGAEERTLPAHTEPVRSVAFSPDGRQAASGSGDGTVKLWATRTGALERTLPGHTRGVAALAFSPDGRQVAIGSRDGTVKLRATRTGAAVRTLPGQTTWMSAVSAVAFSPDGTQLASGSDNGVVTLWDARTGAAERTLPGHTDRVTAVAFSPDGTLVASGSDNGAVTLWDVRTGAAERTLPGHTDRVTAVAFSPDGTLVGSGSVDQRVKLWATRTGALERTLRGHTGWVTAVAFSPDGAQLASGSSDATVKLWDSQTGNLLAKAWCMDGALAVRFDGEAPRLLVADRGGTAYLPDVREYEIVARDARPTLER